MSGIYIPHDKIPTKCMGCSFRDPEYGGDCVLMPSFDAETYEEQFEHCPFKEISHWIGTVPEHGRLIDADALIEKDIDDYNLALSTTVRFQTKALITQLHNQMQKVLTEAPTIIPADFAKDTNVPTKTADKEVGE